MNSKFLKAILPITLLVITVSLIGSGCNSNDDSSSEPACDFEGFTYSDTATNTMLSISDAEVATEFFPNAANGPFGAPGYEISCFTCTDSFIFITNVINLNEVGVGRLTINNGTEMIVGVQCLQTASMEDEQVNFVITGTNISGELCVKIDDVRQ